VRDLIIGNGLHSNLTPCRVACNIPPQAILSQNGRVSIL